MEESGSPWGRRIASGCMVAALVGFGFVLGGLVATRVLYTTDMGWDQIADAMGGSFVGIVTALVVGGVLLQLQGLSVRGRWILVAVSVLGIVLCLAYLRTTPARVRPPADPPSLPPSQTTRPDSGRLLAAPM